MRTREFSELHPVQYHQNFEVCVKTFGIVMPVSFTIKNNLVCIGGENQERVIDINDAWSKDVQRMMQQVAYRMQNDKRITTENRNHWRNRQNYCFGIRGIYVRRIILMERDRIGIEYYWTDGPRVPEHDIQAADGTTHHISALDSLRTAYSEYSMKTYPRFGDKHFLPDVWEHDNVEMYW